MKGGLHNKMYRSNLTIVIHGEDTISSASCEYMHKEQIGPVPPMYFPRGLKTGVSMLVILSLANTVPVEDVVAKMQAAPSAIVEKTENYILYQVLAEVLEDKMSEDEFNKAMTALENIWSACPADLPKDLSAKHDHYLGG